MILVYTPQSGPRIRYIFNLLLGGLIGEAPAFTASTEEFSAFAGPKINYSRDPSPGGLFFEAHGLLNEKEIQSQKLEFVEDGLPFAFFPARNRSACLDFDVFAASFFLVTRYEEYMPFVRDEYGRFQARDSIAWQRGFLDRPVVNIMAGMVAEQIKKKWPRWSPPPRTYRFIPTIDINAAWKYKRKGFFRTTAGTVGGIANGRFGEVLDRMNVISNRRPDPFDTYPAQLALHKDYGLDTIYFVLFAEYDNNDRNIPVNNTHFRVLIKGLADYCRIGIHTSFASLKSHEKLDQEFRGLSEVLNKDITMTRQHFHVLNMPWTYRNFVSRDVEDDYSMGYAVIPGFRAGISDPFNFYDLDYEVETEMKIWPYAIVDKALEQGYELEGSFLPIIESVKAVNGTLVTLWNNESLVMDGQQPANLYLYERMIKMALG